MSSFEFVVTACTVVLCKLLQAIQRLKGKWRTLTYPTSDTDDPINTKICTVDYVGDMMKTYQNGVDRIQGGVYTDVQHTTKCFRFFSVFISINERTAQTAGAILMVNGSKDVVWRKKVPFGGQNNNVEGLGGQIPPRHTICWP